MEVVASLFVADGMNTKTTEPFAYHMTCDDGKTRTGDWDILEEKN